MLGQSVPTVAYVAAHVLLILAIRFGEQQVGQAAADDTFPAWFPLYNLGKQFALAGFVALLQAVLFARMGRSVDRPLWKCEGDSEAIRQYFPTWFMLNLLGMVLQQLQVNAQNSGDEGLMVFMEFVFMIAYMLVIPVGACVMHAGALEWPRAGEILAPIGRQLRQVLLVFVLMSLGYILHFVSVQVLHSALGGEGVDAAVLLPALAIAPPALVECLAFLIMWRILMLDRDERFYDNTGYDF